MARDTRIWTVVENSSEGETLPWFTNFPSSEAAIAQVCKEFQDRLNEGDDEPASYELKPEHFQITQVDNRPFPDGTGKPIAFESRLTDNNGEPIFGECSFVVFGTLQDDSWGDF